MKVKEKLAVWAKDRALVRLAAGVGAALLLMGVQVILIGVVFGLAKNKKKSNEGEN